MKFRYAVTIVVVLSIVLLGAGSSFAQEKMPLPPTQHQQFGPPTPPAATCTDGKHLYVVIGSKINQYTIPDLKLQNTVELPRPAFPEGK